MNRFAVFSACFVVFTMPALYNNTLSMCVINEDWPDAPCFDVLPINREEYRKAWAPYYGHKGSEWMEQKKSEMLEAQSGGKLADWMNSDISNHNVFSYYLSRGEISTPAEYDRPFFEDDLRYYLQFSQMWILTVGIVLVLGAVGVFVYVRRK